MKAAEIQLKYKPKKIKKVKISSSKVAFSTIRDNWNDDTIELFEEFKVMLLNNANEVLGICDLSKGGITQTMVDIRLLFATALKANAVGIITVHNHPSGKTKPSSSDRQLYKKIKNAAEFLDITVLDNLIITKTTYYSFADENE
jgi:DNA repair protein RadC